MLFPANRQAPIAANLTLADATGLPISAEFDFRQTGPQSWDIVADTDWGRMTLPGGGARMAVDGKVVAEAPGRRNIADSIGASSSSPRPAASDVDLAPLRLVADAFLLGKRTHRRTVRGLIMAGSRENTKKTSLSAAGRTRRGTHRAAREGGFEARIITHGAVLAGADRAGRQGQLRRRRARP